MKRIDALAAFTDVPGELTRLFLSPSHKAAADCVASWMREAGMAARIDAIGNVVGRYEAQLPEAPTLLIGSHIDTVRNAGRFDGNLGVVAGIEAVAILAGTGERLPFAIEVIAFGDEEGVRFPMTLSGSKAVAGIFDRAALECRDRHGTRLAEALLAFGGDPEHVPSEARARDGVIGYLEVHIEQGPVLETEDLPVGIVTGINGASRARITVKGQAGHAGTVPMSLRRDALAAAAEMVVGVESRAAQERHLVATVGSLEAQPGAVNVIPGEVCFTLDVRSPSDPQRRRALADIFVQCEGIAARRGVSCTHEVTYEAAAAICSPELVHQLDAAVARAGIRPRRLPSGAGHDGLAMVHLCPIAMLFVRCRGGVSHNPAESISAADADIAVGILVDFLRQFEMQFA
jgi:allantoate deiminase